MAVSRQAVLLGRSAGTAVLSYRGAIPQRRLLAGCFSKSAVRWQTSATSQAKPDSSSSRTEPVVFELPTRYPMVSGQADAMFRPLSRKSDFPRRHIGPHDDSIKEMLAALSPAPTSLEEFVKEVIPADILSSRMLFPEPREKFTQTMAREGLDEWEIQAIGKMMNRDTPVITPMIGQGYYRTHVPEVIKRNILESPAWYTSYTPYQPEISQGRLESLLNFQTMVSDLTALPISNASLLDEGTAAAEAMTVSLNSLPASRAKREGKTFVVSSRVYLQTLNVLCGRAEGLGVRVLTLDLTSPDALSELESLGDDLVGVLVQYPDNLGEAHDFRALADAVHKQGALLSAATDLLALTLLTPPGEWGADIAFGNAQRLGVPLGNGGPHAAFFATKDSLKRKIPGRLIGVSKDRLGGRALRLALQTREQHIRREKATSNVCTAQALLANMSAMYAVYHGPEGLKRIAERCHTHARVLAAAAQHYGFRTCEVAFDTVAIDLHGKAKDFQLLAHRFGISIKVHPSNVASVSIDETTTEGIIVKLSQCFAQIRGMANDNKKLVQDLYNDVQQNGGGLSHLPKEIQRQSSYLAHPVFNSHHSETEMLRYIHHLQSKDLSLVHSMIPLGSCTMKLNGSTEMSLITLPWASDLHPHDPAARTSPIGKVIRNLSLQLADITGMEKTWLQPNSGAQGEFAGLRVIRKYHEGRGDSGRDICLIPVSAHGTNPASAAMAGMRVVPIKCDAKTGNLDLADLEAKCQQHADQLGAIMITYPSTFGVFEPQIKKVCELVHQYGGQVYMDGANMNAQIGLCSPGEIGADVCHLNLHKTFCIPHGGGGPGVGPICVKEHLAPFLPRASPELNMEKASDSLPVSSAIYGSASILPISWSYNAMMGGEGLKKATEVTLLNANYLLSRLKEHYPILYTNEHGRCAHEFILDIRPFHTTAGIEAIDIAKRLQDYGFHAPTMSWPVANTLMIEPTESESKEELDRFVDALVSIREEIREIEEGRAPREGNVLKMAPHPLVDIIGGDGEDGAKWDRPYSRTKAAYPLPWLKEKKFWPSVARVNDTYGDLNLFCTCPPVEDTTGGNLSSVQASI